MTLTVSPYLSTALSGRSPQPAAGEAGAPQQPRAASSGAAADSVTLSPSAQRALQNAPSPADAQKSPLQTTLEMILAGVKNSTGPTLTFQPSAPDNSVDRNLDQSC